MLHDVIVVVFPAGGGTVRHVVTVDAAGGDDAAAQAAIEAATLARGAAWQIRGVGPSAAVQSDVDAPEAEMEGADVVDDVLVPDELETAKRGPGRPRKTAE